MHSVSRQMKVEIRPALMVPENYTETQLLILQIPIR